VADRLARALFRADAGPQVGSGHVIRCLALADALARRGIRSTFATRLATGGLAARITDAGHELLPLPPLEERRSARPGRELAPDAQREELAVLRERLAGPLALLVVDHYGLDAGYERAARPLADRIVAVDDLADRPHDVDLLLDANWYGPGTDRRYDGLVPPRTELLLGPRYAPLQAPYAGLRLRRRPSTHPPRRVLVSFGGTDPTGETDKALEALTDPAFAALEVDVVVGAAERVSERTRALVAARPRTHLHVALPTLAPLLAEADLAVGAGGAATWERVCARLPAIVTTTSDDQSGVTRALAEAGATTWAGPGADTTAERYRALLAAALRTPAPLPPPIVDGEGAHRVAEAMLPTPDPECTVRVAAEADLPAFLGTDPSAPAGFPRALDGPDAWAASEAAFRARLPHGSQWVVLVEGVTVGTVHRDAAEGFHLLLFDAVRGRGLEARVRDAAVELAARGPR
jgi:UDP-2,4-diacetamido-2,4,6-trideoxy-beta-L-altropyranose hydrolase